MRILVCGARDHDNKALIFGHLDEIGSSHRIDAVIEGGAKGADTFAREWAEQRHIPVEEFPANWEEFGRSAGPIRNRQMLQEGSPDLVVAFPKSTLADSRGTKDMVEQAKKADVAIVVVEQHSDQIFGYTL